MLGYILWFISSGIFIYLLFYSRGFYLKIFSIILKDYWQLSILDKFLFIFLAFITLSLIIFLESFYLKDKKKVIHKFLLTTGIQLIVLFSFQFLIKALIRIRPSFQESFLWVLELLVAGIFIGVYFSHSFKR